MSNQSKIVLAVLVAFAVLFTVGIGIGWRGHESDSQEPSPSCVGDTPPPREETPRPPPWLKSIRTWLGPPGQPIRLGVLVPPTELGCAITGTLLTIPENGHCVINIGSSDEKYRNLSLRYVTGMDSIEVAYQPGGENDTRGCTPLMIEKQLAIVVFKAGGTLTVQNRNAKPSKIRFE